MRLIPACKQGVADVAILCALVTLNVIAQSWNNGRCVFPANDEGVYLYTAKLLARGAVPYRDVFLAQPPFLIYAMAALVAFARGVDPARFLLTIWFSLALVPIFLVVRKNTGSRAASVVACVFFATFAEMVQWDGHSFALRQMSLPFLAFAIYFLFVRVRLKTAGALLGLFALCTLSNALVASSLLLTLVASDVAWRRRSFAGSLRMSAPLWITFGTVCLAGYGSTFALPGSVENLVGYQLARPNVPVIARLDILRSMAPLNWPVFAWGLLGSLLADDDLGLFGLFNWIGLAIVVFASRSFHPHYLSILGVGLAISAGLLTGRLATTRPARGVIAAIAVATACFASFVHLKHFLFDAKTPDFYVIVAALEKAPEPLFTVEPIYGLYAGKDLTFHYHVADMRYFRVTGRNLDERTYLDLLAKSQSVLVEPFARSLLPPRTVAYVTQNFQLAFSDPSHLVDVYTRKPPAP